MMKIFLTLLVLLFSSSVVADDISDFEIEGMSVGDSALDHFDLYQIKRAKGDIYCDYGNKKNCTKYYSATFWELEKFKIYDAIRFHAKNNDKKHIIYQLNGQIFYAYDFESCVKKRDSIILDISDVMKNLKKVYEGTYKHGSDKSGKSTIISTEYVFPNGDFISVACYKWSKESGHPYTLHVEFVKKEFNHWLLSIYE